MVYPTRDQRLDVGRIFRPQYLKIPCFHGAFKRQHDTANLCNHMKNPSPASEDTGFLHPTKSCSIYYFIRCSYSFHVGFTACEIRTGSSAVSGPFPMDGRREIWDPCSGKPEMLYNLWGRIESQTVTVSGISGLIREDLFRGRHSHSIIKVCLQEEKLFLTNCGINYWPRFLEVQWSL